MGPSLVLPILCELHVHSISSIALGHPECTLRSGVKVWKVHVPTIVGVDVWTYSASTPPPVLTSEPESRYRIRH
jgi:hypothetical protein